MEHNSVLTFKSMIKSPDSQEEIPIEFVTNANLTEKNDKYYIRFDYPQSPDTETVKATLKIDKNTITLLRYDERCTQFIFEQGKQHMGHYETEFGSLSMGIFSDNVFSDIDSNGGNIKIDYRIYYNDLIANSINLSINLKKI